MDVNISWYKEEQINRTIKNLSQRNIDGFFVNDGNELKELLKQLIGKNSVVGVGDSMTLFETGVIDFLREENYTFLDKYRDGITSEEKKSIYMQNFSADTFMCSTNALTESGELYNIDGNGSRVAPMIYGPKQVILVTGTNKIVKDIEEAEKRVRNYAAPIDAKRLGKDTPCTKLGYCVDCKSPNRICNDFTIIRGQFVKGRIKVIIVGKQLGY
ncbi:lactate utilization protein [Clostridium beijerinckii]|uniref:lactate utilization protein n=1 Tax=Clostridium beijerinckii TaxID=1520 RepID=UPI00098BCFD8|nr:lactate utilization protein [Clostridium beijerinckii]MBA8937021.1 L-lactate utilization protein LutB [Clostridium beijerinckii]NRT33792.1 L-lactate utilization protein LutB [Clostridium beijerinckii]NRT46779.1 L-lactate utilization protein LutB [Clostridium beijerinckii]NRU40514.1 L-lactate utilization protein LutB [Clostridium beijerinckii]NRZ19217.1 L-lactate utilization protein LutB [Clostridium beijerinckii]